MNRPALFIPIVLAQGAHAPARASAGDAGYDLHALEGFTIEPGKRVLVKTGVRMEIPTGYYGRIAPRSGLAHKHGIDTLAGVIDSGYRNDIGVILLNTGDAAVSFTAGDRIAQIIIEACYEAAFSQVDELGSSERGQGGFGSTGMAAKSDSNSYCESVARDLTVVCKVDMSDPLAVMAFHEAVMEDKSDSYPLLKGMDRATRSQVAIKILDISGHYPR